MLECQRCGDLINSRNSEGICSECQDRTLKIISDQGKPIGIIVKDGKPSKIERCFGARHSNRNDLTIMDYTPDHFEKAKELIIEKLEDSDFLELAIKKLLLKEWWVVDINNNGERSILLENITAFAEIGYMKEMIEKDNS